METCDAGVAGSCGGGCCGGLGGKGTDPFIDRSKVRILLCDSDSKSSEEVCGLLCKCSYQVTSVRSARQVIDALNAEGPDIDIILSEIDIPMKKGMKMLKYITRDKDLQRIPVIMMSARDEVPLVVKCLRLGAADYLVKPLRTNELLNLWTHMWRRRRMLGLSEKNIMSYDLEIMASDPSDANTNSTTLFSDDTDDRTRRSVNPEMAVATQQEFESFIAPPGTVFVDSLECRPNVPGINDRRRGQFSSFPKKSELKIGESSAFFAYVKSSMQRNNTQGAFTCDETSAQPLRANEKSKVESGQVLDKNTRGPNDGEALEINSQGEDFPSSTSFPDSTSMERSCSTPVSLELLHSKSNDEGTSHVHMQPRSGTHHDTPGFIPHASYPYFMSGMMNQVLMPPSAHFYQNHANIHNHENSSMLPQHNNLSQCPSHVPGMASIPYYPVNMCVPPGQVPSNHKWPSFGSSSAGETKVGKVDRREAALIKFRQKRKERCFDKKIRYENRKKLAERRPRVRGQFVRKINGVAVDLNGEPSSADMEEDYEEDDPASRDSSPDNDVLRHQYSHSLRNASSFT